MVSSVGGEESTEELENDYLDEAFAAAQAGDPKAFKRAMKGAFYACIERRVKAKSLNDETEGY